MKKEELKVKSISELEDELLASQKKLFNLKLQKDVNGDGQRAQTHNLKIVRRRIARLKTILNEKRKS